MFDVDALRIAWMVAVMIAVPSTAIADETDNLETARGTVHRALQTARDAGSGSHSGEQVAGGEEAATEPESEADSSADQDAELTAEELAMIEASVAADSEDKEPTASEPEPVDGEQSSVSAAMASLSMNPDIALILDVALAAFSSEPQQVGAHDPSQNGFNLQQLEMSMGANIDPYFRLDANLVFSQFGVEVEEAYATTLALPWNLQARAGQFLTAFGRLNPTHPHSWKFLDQPLVNGKFFGGEGSRGLGAELSWLSPLPWYVELAGSATQADGECCARSFYGGDNLGVDGPADVLYTTRIEQFFAFGSDVGLLWGVTGQFGPNPTGLGSRSEIYGTDLYLRWRPSGNTSRTSVNLTVEAMMRQRQVPDDLLRDFGTRSELVWQINPRWETGVRHEFVTGIEDDPLDPEWTGNRQRVALQQTFYPSHFSRLRLQTAWDAPEWRDDPILAVMLGLEVLAGAHGSHDY